MSDSARKPSLTTVELYTPRKRRKFARRATNRPKKRKPYSLKKLDTNFSDKIKDRDKRCLFPACTEVRREKLTCSHYFSRGKWGTRFDEKNCITLCFTHHFWDKDVGWEFQKQRKGEKGCDWDGRYTLFMKEWLGEAEFALLEERSKVTGNRAAIIKEQLCLQSSTT